MPDNSDSNIFSSKSSSSSDNNLKNNNLTSLEKLLTPKEIVSELDKDIIGQYNAKKAVAIALRNRYRRSQIANPLKDEIIPKNILSIGPTGVGKTEIARRLAKKINAPFIKVEATKFTEVGYVGRDVESIIRDLMEIAISKTKKIMEESIKNQAEENAKKIILKIFLGDNPSEDSLNQFKDTIFTDKILSQKEIEIEISEDKKNKNNNFELGGNIGIGMINIGDMISKVMSGEKKKKIKLPIYKALEKLKEEEVNKLIDEDILIDNAKKLAENDAIIFIDEFDKICSNRNVKGGDVSREGVQRDLLPLVEGCSVSTKYGIIKTDHMLFIASGAFYSNKPSDLLPELQGRFPIRVKLDDLTEDDFIRILTEPQFNLILQYKKLLEVENIDINFTKSAIKKIASIACHLNSEVENIGARRLYSLIEKILEDISFNHCNEVKNKKITINDKYVEKHLKNVNLKKIDLSKFIL